MPYCNIAVLQYRNNAILHNSSKEALKCACQFCGIHGKLPKQWAFKGAKNQGSRPCIVKTMYCWSHVLLPPHLYFVLTYCSRFYFLFIRRSCPKPFSERAFRPPHSLSDIAVQKPSIFGPMIRSCPKTFGVLTCDPKLFKNLRFLTSDQKLSKNFRFLNYNFLPTKTQCFWTSRCKHLRLLQVSLAIFVCRV